MDRDQLEQWVDLGWSTQRIAREVGRDRSTVAYWLGKHGLASPYRERHAPRGALGRAQMEEMVARGLTHREMADEVDRSLGTVRHRIRPVAREGEAGSAEVRAAVRELPR